MSEKKFKFVSPGIFIDEIDKSQLSTTANEKIGPVVIGRAAKGPAMRVTRVDNYSEFVDVFGAPIAGGKSADTWRNGNQAGPTYAGFAAKAWLTNNSPLNFVRLLGTENALATTTGYAGWNLGTPDPVQENNHGAFGLFLVNSGTAGVVAGGDHSQLTGTLAAVFYVATGSVSLKGVLRQNLDGGSPAAVTGSATLIAPDSNNAYTLQVNAADGTISKTFSFDLTTGANGIRKVCNTDPTLTNTNITATDNQETYWLGQSFERAVAETVTSGSGHQFGMILSLDSGSAGGADFSAESQAGETGWFIAQDTGANTDFNAETAQKLFKLVGLDGGEWLQNNYKVSIEDIKTPTNDNAPWGTFTVALRGIEDKDSNPAHVERFTECNLNPNSPHYVAAKIGDAYAEWDSSAERYRHYGSYANKSKYVRVVMDETSAIEGLVPFGVHGPIRFKGFNILSGSTSGSIFPLSTYHWTVASASQAVFVDEIDLAQAPVGDTIQFGLVGGAASLMLGQAITASYYFPAVSLVNSSNDHGHSDKTTTYFGAHLGKSTAVLDYDTGVPDLLRALPGGVSSTAPTTSTEKSWIFTMDDLSGSAGANADSKLLTYVSGSRQKALDDGSTVDQSYTAANSAASLINLGFNKFTTVFAGGHDGLDIREKEPFGNHVTSGKNEKTSYAYNTIKRAIDSLADAELSEFNLATVPGVTTTGLTDLLVQTCESRGDALAIIDLEDDYTPKTESSATEAARLGSVDDAATSIQARNFNSSYGCAFYPWVRTQTSTGAPVWLPPSVVALGVMGSSETKSELWFAPAGFTRGGLQGQNKASGLIIDKVRQQLTSKERDKLYENNINPIAKFPAEGIVIFGQKTLQATPSALDRINVRRLMIYVKKEISRMAATLLFDQNVQATWDRFTSQAVPFLSSIKVRFGLTDFKVTLDETTTTPDLIDRNILYAKIFLKPARAIEFIALDFVIMNSGASFED